MEKKSFYPKLVIYFQQNTLSIFTLLFWLFQQVNSTLTAKNEPREMSEKIPLQYMGVGQRDEEPHSRKTRSDV